MKEFFTTSNYDHIELKLEVDGEYSVYRNRGGEFDGDQEVEEILGVSLGGFNIMPTGNDEKDAAMLRRLYNSLSDQIDETLLEG